MHYFQRIQFNSGIIISCFLTFLFFLIRVHYCEQTLNMIVEVQQGKLTGIKKNSVFSGKEFYGFLGIPYAKPPVGDLRFRPPVPAEKWEGIRDATIEGNACIQSGVKGSKGSEDCLYLNVYTPEPPLKSGSLKPVIVYIHGGGFQTGSGSEESFGPDYIMDYDVILVTLNYRLNIFGFLNLNVPDCSGNYGLKDQSLALKWVKDNIKQFGGNPENITLAGESAGSASVHYQTISPTSTGLFQRAIMQSGNVLNKWAFDRNPTDVGFRLAKKLGLQTNNLQNVVDSLKNLTEQDLSALAAGINNDLKEVFPYKLVLPFVPSAEEVGENKFITDVPEKMIQFHKPIPLMFGLNSKEGIIKLLSMQEESLKKFNNDFVEVIKQNFDFNENLVTDIAQKVKEFYFKGKPIDLNALDEFVDLYTNMLFGDYYAPRELIMRTNGLQPIYEYEFDFDGKFNSFKINVPLAKNIKGASHSDGLGYLFYQKKTFLNPEFVYPEIRIIKTMCKIWTNFAKTGNPNPVDEENVIEWPPSTERNSTYLHISNSFTKVVHGKIFGDNVFFWEELLKQIRKL